MSLNKIDASLIVFICISIGLSVYILATDDHIYEHAPSHAYGLMVFIGVYSTLLGLWKFRANMAKKGILIMAIIQFVVMNLDIFTTESIPIFQVQGLEFEELLEHLYGSWYFNVLLGAQAVLIGLSLVNRQYAKRTVMLK